MKISELTTDIIKDFCGITDDDSDRIISEVLLPSAKSYIKGYTGLSDDEADRYDELTTACLVLINDGFTNRDYTISMQKQVNPTVRTILGMYSKNYL
ncbi:MAG: head-tail connector protein [Ruminococcus flavefaciens]|nr:head-tail connector protein [Ruminococcus flavefaciens]MCM1232657.1 head-tail connector protein [Ruminococcus flavefaciens]